MNEYRTLEVWKKSMNLVADLYRIIKILPSEERFAIADQMRRAAISIPLNIAEGQGRKSIKEYVHFLSISRGSLYEIETLLLLCVQLNYIAENELTDIFKQIDEISKILTAMINKLNI